MKSKSKIGKKHGWKKQLDDFRDIPYSLPENLIIPNSIDLRSVFPPIKDQMSLGCCTGFGTTYLWEFLDKKNGLPYNRFSELFMYYNEREEEGTILSDEGANIRDGIRAGKLFGLCYESEWKYIPEKFAVKPTPKCYTDAIKHEELIYYSLDNNILPGQTLLGNIKACLTEGYPIVQGATLFSQFESNIANSTGIITMPQQGDEPIGGHCFDLVGFNDAEQIFICANSWGNWGQNGFFVIPQEYILTYGSDFWTIRKI